MGIWRSFRDKRDHAWSGRHMSDYIDRDLSPADRERLKRHAEGCPECGPMLRMLVATVSALGRLGGARRGSVAAATIERIRAADERQRAGP